MGCSLKVDGTNTLHKNLVMPSLRVLLLLHIAVPCCVGVIITTPGKPEVTISHTGLEISSENAHREFNAASECQCRMECAVLPGECVGYSYSPDQTCRLAYRYSLGVPKSGAVYIYYLPDGLPKDTIQEKDGLYYYYHNQDGYTMTAARAECLTRPGFRLAQAKTKQTADIFRNIHEHVDYYVDLSKLPNGTLAWGDGTLLQSGVLASDEPRNNDNTRSPVGVGQSGIFGAGTPAFYCYPDTEEHGYLCQANYDDQPW